MKSSLMAVILSVGSIAVVTTAFATPLTAQVQQIVYPLSNGKITKKLKAANGALPNFDVRNELKINATDIHFTITKPAGYKIKQVITDAQFPDRRPNPNPPANDPPSASGSADGGVVPPSTVQSPQQLSVQLKVVNAQGAAVDDEEVEFTIQWSNLGAMCSMVSPTEIGGPSGALLANVIPDYNASPVTVTVGTAELACNDIAVGEVFHYRFESGSLVVRPSSGRFELQADTAVKGFNEDGDDVTGSAAFSVSNIRVNDRGYLVFEVSRNRNHDLHVAIVIRGVRLTQLDLDERPRDIHVTMSGAALSGEDTEEAIHVATVQEQEAE